MDVILDAKSIPHLDYCKDLPTASISLKTVSFGGDVLKPRSDHVTSCLHPDSGPQHKLLWLFKVQKSGALTVLWSYRPTRHERSLSARWLISGWWMKSMDFTERLPKAKRES